MLSTNCDSTVDIGSFCHFYVINLTNDKGCFTKCDIKEIDVGHLQNVCLSTIKVYFICKQNYCFFKFSLCFSSSFFSCSLNYVIKFSYFSKKMLKKRLFFKINCCKNFYTLCEYCFHIFFIIEYLIEAFSFKKNVCTIHHSTTTKKQRY